MNPYKRSVRPNHYVLQQFTQFSSRNVDKRHRLSCHDDYNLCYDGETLFDACLLIRMYVRSVAR